MPSPFPGMDPYLEAPDLWPDFHNALAGEIRNQLNSELAGRRGSLYYARLELRAEIGIVGGEGSRRIIPDLAIIRRGRPAAAAGAVVLAEPSVVEFSPSVEIAIRGDLSRHLFVEIRDPARGHKLVTLIEILSPSNKRPGPDRRAFEAKQAEILESDAGLVEIDLLRAGERILSHLELVAEIDRLEPRPDYAVFISRAWRRTSLQVYPCGLRDRLPRVSIPLAEGEPELPLDLQAAFDRAYDTGPYLLGAVDYDGPPDPTLSPDDAAWAEALLRQGRA